MGSKFALRTSHLRISKPRVRKRIILSVTLHLDWRDLGRYFQPKEESIGPLKSTWEAFVSWWDWMQESSVGRLEATSKSKGSYQIFLLSGTQHSSLVGMRDASYYQLLIGILCWVEIDHAAFARYHWSTSVFGHLEQQEEISGNAPQEKGKRWCNPVAPCLSV